MKYMLVLVFLGLAGCAANDDSKKVARSSDVVCSYMALASQMGAESRDLGLSKNRGFELFISNPNVPNGKELNDLYEFHFEIPYKNSDLKKESVSGYSFALCSLQEAKKLNGVTAALSLSVTKECQEKYIDTPSNIKTCVDKSLERLLRTEIP